MFDKGQKQSSTLSCDSSYYRTGCFYTILKIGINFRKLQSNLYKSATFGSKLNWLLYTGGCLIKGQSERPAWQNNITIFQYLNAYFNNGILQQFCTWAYFLFFFCSNFVPGHFFFLQRLHIGCFLQQFCTCAVFNDRI